MRISVCVSGWVGGWGCRGNEEYSFLYTDYFSDSILFLVCLRVFILYNTFGGLREILMFSDEAFLPLMSLISRKNIRVSPPTPLEYPI